MPPKDRLNYGVKCRCLVITDSSSSAHWESLFTEFDPELKTSFSISQDAGVKKRTQKFPTRLNTTPRPLRSSELSVYIDQRLWRWREKARNVIQVGKDNSIK